MSPKLVWQLNLIYSVFKLAEKSCIKCSPKVCLFSFVLLSSSFAALMELTAQTFLLTFHIHVRQKSKEIIFFYKLSMLREFDWKTNFYGNYSHEAAMLSEAMNPCKHWVKITCGLDLMMPWASIFYQIPFLFLSSTSRSVLTLK